MFNTKLINILKTLSTSELRRFNEYVHSPFFNKNEHVIRLMDSIYIKAPHFNSPALERMAAYSHVFPKQKFNEANFNNIISDLFVLLTGYLSQTNYSSDVKEVKRQEITALRKRKLDKAFKKSMLQLNQEVELFHDEHFYFHRFQLAAEADLFFIQQGVRVHDKNLQEKLNNLDLFYLSCKLKNTCEAINRKNIIGTDFKSGMLEELMDHIGKNISTYSSVPSVIVYYHILKTLLDPADETPYESLLDAIGQHDKSFSLSEKQAIYQYAQNYCTKKMNTGNAAFIKKLFELYQLLLQSEIIFENNFISHGVYKNIVAVALRLEEFTWTKEFIEKYKNRLPAEHIDNAYTYNLSMYYVSMKDYRNALRLLQQVEFTDVFYHLGAKTMLLRSYYELEETESFYSLIEAFKVYLKRNKEISDYQYEIHFKLVKYSKKIFNLRLKYSESKNAIVKNEIEKLKTIIENTKNITNAQWLLEKIKEL